MTTLDKDSLNRAASRIASGVVRKARRLRERLLAPDAFEAQVAAARAIAAAAPLEQQVIIITGSSRGVGLALAEALGRGGAKIVINGRDHERLGKAARQLDEAGIEMHAVLADVATPAGAAALIEAAIGHYGRIDALINNAGVSGPVKTRAWEVDPKDWAPVLDANLAGVFHCAREAMRQMRASGNAGRIVNVSSGAGRAAAPGMAPYVASKFGLEGLTRALAMDADGTGIVVCAIELGTLRTDMSKVIVPFGEHERLPPPQTVVPVFVHALTGPAEQVSGRVYAAWRFEHDA
ncbi:MAG: SDR family oxidoreductase, partial [Rhodobacteraceae bacterium]|nr:SDR family oxidoreductase [Paracoccaceae bacterium]